MCHAHFLAASKIVSLNARLLPHLGILLKLDLVTLHLRVLQPLVSIKVVDRDVLIDDLAACTRCGKQAAALLASSRSFDTRVLFVVVVCRRALRFVFYVVAQRR